MKTITITATLMLAALPLAAQADPATERALELNQEPLSRVEASATSATSATVDLERLDGGSDAMAQARLRLRSQQATVMTGFADSDDAYRLAREATS